MKLQLTIHLTSRFDNDDMTVHEAAELHRRVEEWSAQLVRENNVASEHVGIHFHMDVIDLFRVDNPNMIWDDADTWRAQ